MKKSIVLASILFSSFLTADDILDTCVPSSYSSIESNFLGSSDYGTIGYSQKSFMGGNVFYKFKSTLRCFQYNTGTITTCSEGDHTAFQNYYDLYYNAVLGSNCYAPTLSSFDNNPSGCVSAGGYYFNDGKCVDGTDAIAKVFTDPTAIIGSLIFLNGAAWSIAGAYALPVTGGASGAAIAYGGHAMVAGLATLGVSALGQLYNQPDTVTPKSDSTTGETRIKVKLQSDNSTTIAQGDISSGKVESISYIPAEVKQRILEGVVNPTTGLPNNITQSDLAGTTVTKYNYSTNTATTETVKSDGTTVTSTTPFTPITSPTGEVTAQSHNEAVAPTVTGTKGTTINVPEWNQYQTIAQWTETIKTNSGTGSTSGGGSTGTVPVNTGDATADAIVNAPMPAYSLPDNGDFEHLSKTNNDSMADTADGLIDNISNQIDSVKTVYDQTQTLLTDGFTAPNIPTGQCGNGLQLDIWGKHIDLCPEITNFISPYSNLIALLITMAGLVFAISIFLGGM